MNPETEKAYREYLKRQKNKADEKAHIRAFQNYKENRIKPEGGK